MPRPTAASAGSTGSRRPTTSTPGALTFLSQVLLGDSEWSLAEVRRLVALRERARYDHS